MVKNLQKLDAPIKVDFVETPPACFDAKKFKECTLGKTDPSKLPIARAVQAAITAHTIREDALKEPQKIEVDEAALLNERMMEILLSEARKSRERTQEL